jgi:hypothetical protein
MPTLNNPAGRSVDPLSSRGAQGKKSCEAETQAHRDQLHPFLQNQLQDIAWLRSEGYSDADFVPAAADGVRR